MAPDQSSALHGLVTCLPQRPHVLPRMPRLPSQVAERHPEHRSHVSDVPLLPHRVAAPARLVSSLTGADYMSTSGSSGTYPQLAASECMCRLSPQTCPPLPR